MNILDKVLQELMSKVTPEAREFARSCRDEWDFSCAYHHNFGRALRNHYSLWHDNSKELRREIWDVIPEEKREFYINYWKQYDLGYVGENMHADDAYHELISAVYRTILIEERAKQKDEINSNFSL